MRGQPTSAIALQQAEQSGKLNGKRFEVARAFELYGPGTSAEVLSKARLDKNRNLMRARVTELADLGWLKALPARKCGQTGRKAIVWSFERTEPRSKTGKITGSKAELAEYVKALANMMTYVLGNGVPAGADVADNIAKVREFIANARAAAGVKP